MATTEVLTKIKEGLTPVVQIISFSDEHGMITGAVQYVVGEQVVGVVNFEVKKGQMAIHSKVHAFVRLVPII